ncbi:MAG: lycopene cyclase domain-containing protein [Rhodothermales bacterium]
MTYLQFHLVFILPPLAVLLGMALRRGLPAGAWKALLWTTLIALIYTTPWDNYLVYASVWVYGPERVLGTIGYVPLEEYLFFLLQPLLTGLFYLLFFAATPPGDRNGGPGVVAVMLALAAAGAGMLLWGAEKWTYLGLILAWACPVLAGMWFYGGGYFGTRWRAMWLAALLPSVYLWIADRIAIGLGIWTIAESTSTGIMLLGLPVEEATFFLLTDLLVVSGVSLFLHGAHIAAHRQTPAQETSSLT